VRSGLVVPLVREGTAIGTLFVRRRQQLPFSERQVALLETFADQAVIAIENTRLYAELQESNATLREALEQQTATADVLRIISRAPPDLDRVLPALADNTRRLFGAHNSVIRHIEDGVVTRAVRSPTGGPDRFLGQPIGAGSLPMQVLTERRA